MQHHAEAKKHNNTKPRQKMTKQRTGTQRTKQAPTPHRTKTTIISLAIIATLWVVVALVSYYYRRESIRQKEREQQRQLERNRQLAKQQNREAEQWRWQELKREYADILVDPHAKHSHDLIRSGRVYERYAGLFVDPDAFSCCDDRSGASYADVAEADAFSWKPDSELLLSRYLTWRKSLSEDEIQKLVNRMVIRDVYHSTGIEGNTASLDDTTHIIQNRRVYGGGRMNSLDESNEIIDQYEAELYVLGLPHNDNRITVEDIMNIHKYVVRRTIDDPLNHMGRWRTKPVGIYATKILLPQPEEIPELMNRFVAFINSTSMRAAHPIIQACLVHYNFVRIHPFIDGNGRTARLLMNLVLLRHSYPIISIKRSEAKQYFQLLSEHGKIQQDLSLDQSNTPKRSPFCELISRRVTETLNALISNDNSGLYSE